MMTIRRFPFKDSKVLVPLKLSKYFKTNGYRDINEMDWYDEININKNLKVTFLPAVHWSKRSLTDTNKTLWGSFLIEYNGKKILFACDTGYGNIYKDLGKKYGPIDISFINIGAYNLSRKAFELGIKTSTLIFTVIHSVNLMLLTTSQEDFVWGLSWFLYPLRKIGLPISKWLFQLLIALRFIPLVQEEFQNIIKSVSVRSINFRNLGLKKSFNVLLILVERLFHNIFLRIDHGAESLLSKKNIIIKTNRFRTLYPS